MKMWERDQRNYNQGVKEGIELNQLEVARSMLLDNFPDEQILKYSRCSPELLEKVKASMDCGDNPEGTN